MTLNLNIPDNLILKPRIIVCGIGGAGGNAVNNMVTAGLEGAEFIAFNTDAQALQFSKAPIKLQLGENTTRGLGAGAEPGVGSASAEESLEQISSMLEGSNMVFITAGMGGGTGTGAAPVIARIARAMGLLTIGVVTKPFHFEGGRRMRVAEEGISELQKYVDTLIVIPNQNLFRVTNERTTLADAFKMADDVLHAGVRGVTDLITMPGLINLDFADIVTIMSKMGKAMMGTGEASGENRAIHAAEAAISNPLLDHTSMKGARGVLINITGGMDMTLFEVDEAANRIREEVDGDANIIFGSTFNPSLEGKIRITVVATGIDIESNKNAYYGISPEQNSKPAAAAEEEYILENQSSSDESNNDSKEFRESGILSTLSNIEELLDEELSSSSKAEKFTAPLQNDIFDADNNSLAKENNDIAQPPEGIKATASSYNNSRFINDNKSSNQGIFSRMASSMFSFGSDKKRSVETSSGQKNAPKVEDNLDIPAFLRRKNK